MSKINRRDFKLALMGALTSPSLAPTKTLTLGSELESEASEGCITEAPGVKVGHFTDSRTRNQTVESPSLRPVGFGTWKLARRRLAIQVNSRYYTLTSGYSLP